MPVTSSQEMELKQKHEEMLKTMQKIEKRMEQHRRKTQEQVRKCEDAQHRNAALMQDLQKMEEHLRVKQLPEPSHLALQMRYWAYVEQSIPVWENFLLGKGPHPTNKPSPPSKRAQQKPGQGLPPRPSPRITR